MIKIIPGTWTKVLKVYSPYTYWQHAIVSEVSVDHIPTKVIHFDKGQVREVPINHLLEPGQSAHIVDKTTPHPSVVLINAKSKIGKTDYQSSFHFTEDCFVKENPLTWTETIFSMAVGMCGGILIGNIIIRVFP